MFTRVFKLNSYYQKEKKDLYLSKAGAFASNPLDILTR